MATRFYTSCTQLKITTVKTALFKWQETDLLVAIDFLIGALKLWNRYEFLGVFATVVATALLYMGIYTTYLYKLNSLSILSMILATILFLTGYVLALYGKSKR